MPYTILRYAEFSSRLEMEVKLFVDKPFIVGFIEAVHLADRGRVFNEKIFICGEDTQILDKSVIHEMRPASDIIGMAQWANIISTEARAHLATCVPQTI